MQKKTQKNLETNFGMLTIVEMKIQVQSTKCKRRLSETEEETRLFCVNEDLMIFSDTTVFCNLFSNFFSEISSNFCYELSPRVSLLLVVRLK